jgi:NDP-4-keto-2,6-dideoxyhexose 3-C-methyltransferase
MSISTCDQCRICHSTNLVDVVDLGSQYLASRFPRAHEKTDVPVCPVVLSMCKECTLVQLKHSIDQPSMYEHQYGYRSGISNTMRTHLQAFNQEIQQTCSIPITHVLDIGSNDTTFLRYYPDTVHKVGCDPTGKQFASFYDGITLVPTYFMASTIAPVVPAEKFSVVSSISMFYDLPDPVQFAKDICAILQPDGLWVFEQSYALHMIEQNSFDTICHEHLEYYNLRNIQDICTRADMKIVNISFNSCNGGSMRIYAAKQESSYASFDALESLLAKEAHLYEEKTYHDWMASCKKEIDTLRTFAQGCKHNNQSIYVYGASTKGNTLLQYAGLDNTVLQFAVERNPSKVGKFTPGTNIEIISEETMREQSPPVPYLLVLPWHFKDEIVEREQAYLEAGGTLLFPLPTFTLVTKKK